jgi:uncharacterized protein YggT (Ycf19 family)
MRFADKANLVLLVVELALAIRLTVELAGAHGTWETLARVSAPLAVPFARILPSFKVGDSLFDPATALAMLALACIVRAFVLVADIVRKSVRRRQLATVPAGSPQESF